MQPVSEEVMVALGAKSKPQQNSAGQTARLVLLPTVLLCLIAFYGSIGWTIAMSFTPSGILPKYDWAGFDQYLRLWNTPRWHQAFSNMFVFGGIYILGCLSFGILLAIAVDQGGRGRNLLQSLFLYPIALSFIVTGLAWQWFLNPIVGLQAFVRGLGAEEFVFDWLSSPQKAVFTLVIAGLWHSSGLVMAIVYAGLGAIDDEIWRAARIDGISKPRMYRRVILPMLKPVLLVCVVFLAMNVVKSYDLVVAMTGGGPGFSTDVPAKFVVDHLFQRANIGLASAAATVMLIAVLLILVLSTWRQRRGRTPS